MATAYIVAATPSSPEPKRITNLKSAKREADARAKLDRVDVDITTVATGKLTYTAQGAPLAPAAPQPQAPADEPQAATEDDGADEGEEDGEGFEAILNSVIDEATATVAQAAAITAALENAAESDEGDEDDDAAPAAPEGDDHRGQADCGCSVEKIIESGEHGKGCADAPKAAAAAKAVERDKPVRPARTGGGGRRESQGTSVVDGWDLLYDKPGQKAQVGRSADGKYALICTTHKHAHPLSRLTQERGLRGGKRSVWCPSCTDK